MRAVEIVNAGPQGQLRLCECEKPSPGPGEVLIRVHHAGVNRADVFQRLGLYPAPPGGSLVPGLEVAGEVAAVGEGVTLWRPGDRVCALLEGGGYGEYCTAPQGQVLSVPAGMGTREAAALPEGLFTVWLALIEKGRLQAGERLLVHGGASGIGTFAIQLARWRGAEIYATAGSPEKRVLCEQLGARRAFLHKTEDFLNEINKMTDGKGVQVVLDMTGGENIQKNLSALAVGGRLVQIAFLRGAKAQINAAPLLLKQLTWAGMALRSCPREKKAATAEQLRQQIWPELESGKIIPVIDSVYPLAQSTDAHQRMEENLNLGKIVLTI